MKKFLLPFVLHVLALHLFTAKALTQWSHSAAKTNSNFSSTEYFLLTDLLLEFFCASQYTQVVQKLFLRYSNTTLLRNMKRQSWYSWQCPSCSYYLEFWGWSKELSRRGIN